MTVINGTSGDNDLTFHATSNGQNIIDRLLINEITGDAILAHSSNSLNVTKDVDLVSVDGGLGNDVLTIYGVINVAGFSADIDSGICFDIVGKNNALTGVESISFHFNSDNQLSSPSNFTVNNYLNIASLTAAIGDVVINTIKYPQYGGNLNFNDTVWSNNGNDIIYTYGGDDWVLGAGGNDLIYGGNGNDTLGGNIGNDTIDAGDGADSVRGGEGNDVLNGYTGNDQIFGDEGADSINGSYGDDLIYGGADGDSLFGDNGYDTLDGGDGNDSVVGGAGNDTVLGDDGVDTLNGGDGNDSLNGGQDADIINGDAGKDILKGGSENDMLNGGDGDDKLYGDTGNDALFGGIGNDYQRGGFGNDTIKGDVGNDKLLGEEGNDVLIGGAGVDTLTGGDGADVFIFLALTDSTATARDSITDFVHGQDMVDVRGLGFDGLQGQGAAGAHELKLVYSAAADRTYVKDTAASGFEFFLSGDHRLDLTESDFLFV